MKPAAQDPLAQLTEIRAIMERSSRFLSLSGLSGVGAGVVALVGTAVGNYYLTIRALQHNYRELAQSTVSERWQMLPFLLGLSLAMIGAALLVAAFFTLRRTRREGCAHSGRPPPGACWPPCSFRWPRAGFSASSSTSRAPLSW
ncbi:hypothetical protein [Hymenobacter sp. BRD67]|uniref:hypothetical protein n=1 Tax=Hymenobacter sp. BRD67 TaxID=2675877 RepID=UPI0020B7A027|nr:hypothetical protein [Hymenobacter sp. BRD67]